MTNLTVGHLVAFLMMVQVVSLFVSGTKLLRLVCWIGLWQLFSPVRTIWIDIPMMLMGGLLLELVFIDVTRLFGLRGK